MSQTQEDDMGNTLEEVVEETPSTTDTVTNTTKTLRKRKAPARILNKVNIHKRNQTIHKDANKGKKIQ